MNHLNVLMHTVKSICHHLGRVSNKFSAVLISPWIIKHGAGRILERPPTAQTSGLLITPLRLEYGFEHKTLLGKLRVWAIVCYQIKHHVLICYSLIKNRTVLDKAFHHSYTCQFISLFLIHHSLFLIIFH